MKQAKCMYVEVVLFYHFHVHTSWCWSVEELAEAPLLVTVSML